MLGGIGLHTWWLRSVLQDGPNEPLIHGKAALMTQKPSSTEQESQVLAGLDSDSMDIIIAIRFGLISSVLR